MDKDKEEKLLKLVFKDSQDKSFLLAPKVTKENLSQSTIEKAMKQILEANILLSSAKTGASLVKISAAYWYASKKTPIFTVNEKEEVNED